MDISQGIMVLGDHVECGFNISDQNVTVLDLNPELSLQGLVDLNRCIDISKTTLVAPVGIERNRHSLSQ